MSQNAHSRRTAVLLFAAVHVLLGVLGVPGLIVAFQINIVEPNTHMGFALAVLIAGSVLTVVDTVGFGVGLHRSSHHCEFRMRKLGVLSVVFSISTLLLVPLMVFMIDELICGLLPSGWQRGFLRWQVITVPASAMLAATILGVAAGRSCRQPIEERICSGCDYNLKGNVSGVCPECGDAIPRRD